jgi:phytoene synthase
MPDPTTYCRDQARRLDNDRFVCSLFAPEPARADLAAILAFNLEIASLRERVREPMLGRIRLQWWRDAIEDLYAGRPPSGHPVLPALAAATARSSLEREPFDRLLTAREQDFADAPPASLAALVDYAEDSSSSLLALGLTVLGVDGDAERRAARDVGIAWALIGLMRAIPFHAGIGRFWLPDDLMRAAGLRTADLRRPTSRERLGRVVGEIVGCAEDRLRAARTAGVDRRSPALPVLLPATLADGYVRALRSTAFDPFTAPSRRPAGRLLRLAANYFRGRY